MSLPVLLTVDIVSKMLSVNMNIFISRFSFQSLMQTGCYQGELIQFLILLTPSPKIESAPLGLYIHGGDFLCLLSK